MASKSLLHIVLFPFMSKGHTIPLLLGRGAAVTLFTTPANRPFISESLSDTATTIISLPFPEKVDGIPAGVESTDKLPDISLFFKLALATKSMKPEFEKALQNLPFVTFMITDGFLAWTLDSATKFGIPRLAYYGMGNFAMTISRVVVENQLLLKADYSDDMEFPVTDFESIKLTRNDFEPAPKGLHHDFHMESIATTMKSYGLISNSFYELESRYIDYSNREYETKSWHVGPFCLVDQQSVTTVDVKPWMKWLDQKLAEGKPILYVAFGSQADFSVEQFNEIKIGLEKSNVNFLWVIVRKMGSESDGFEEKVRDKGMVVRGWVDQRAILGHESVQGFLSHCGWNSVLESVCARVPILAWPVMAEQHLNARFVAEDIKVGLRVETVNGSVRGFVKSQGLEKMVRELMEGEMGKVVMKNVKEVGETAVKAVAEGGSSWQSLNELISDIQAKRTQLFV